MTRTLPATRPSAVQRPLAVVRGAVVLGAVLVVAVALVALVVAQQRLQVVAGDGISYLSIARQYAEGDVADAVNAYWSPMVP